MTDDPKDRPELEIGDDPLAADLAASGIPEPELEPEAEPVPSDLDPITGDAGREAGGEAAPDLNANELEAAASAAENEVESDEARAAFDAEIADAEVAGADDLAIEGDETAVIEAAPALAPGTGALERPVARAGVRAPRGPKPARTVFAVDPALRIKDSASAAFVVGTVLVFGLIFANALAFGHGGAFHPLPTAAPIATPGPTRSTGPSGSPGASGSPAASPSIAPTPSPSVAPSPAAT